MTPAKKHKSTDGAMRAAKQIERDPSFVESTAEIIDRETGVRELAGVLENILAKQAISSRAAARNSLPKRAPHSVTLPMKLRGRPNDRSVAHSVTEGHS